MSMQLINKAGALIVKVSANCLPKSKYFGSRAEFSSVSFIAKSSRGVGLTFHSKEPIPEVVSPNVEE